MICSINSTSIRDLDFRKSSLVIERERRRDTRFRINRVAARLVSLSTVEIPLLSVILLIFGISVILAPGNVIRSTGLDLPDLFVCPVLALTNVPCLFCGLTRSFMAMGGLDIRQAFIFHPLGPMLYVAMLLTGAVLVWSIVTRRRLRLLLEPAFRNGLIRLAVAVTLVAWIAKLIIWNQNGLL